MRDTSSDSLPDKSLDSLPDKSLDSLPDKPLDSLPDKLNGTRPDNSSDGLKGLDHVVFRGWDSPGKPRE